MAKLAWLSYAPQPQLREPAPTMCKDELLLMPHVTGSGFSCSVEDLTVYTYILNVSKRQIAMILPSVFPEVTYEDAVNRGASYISTIRDLCAGSIGHVLYPGNQFFL